MRTTKSLLAALFASVLAASGALTACSEPEQDDVELTELGTPYATANGNFEYTLEVDDAASWPPKAGEIFFTILINSGPKPLPGDSQFDKIEPYQPKYLADKDFTAVIPTYTVEGPKRFRIRAELSKAGTWLIPLDFISSDGQIDDAEIVLETK